MIKILKSITVYSLCVLYTIIGVKHFTDLDFFLVIIPPYLPNPELLVYVSGFFEILFGVLLIPIKTRKYAALGLVILLIAVFPANIYLFNSEIAQNSYGISRQFALIRLPYQIPLIVIAYWHSRENSSKKFDLIAVILFIPTIIYFLSLG